MHVRSLALQTELALAATRGRVTDRGGYIVVETPDDPGYYFGNLLVLPAAPQVGEVGYWTRKLAEELPAIRHAALRWDGTTGDAGAIDELRAHGYTIETSQVMIAATVVAPPSARAVVALSPDDVLHTADLAWSLGDRHDESYRQFLHRRAAWHRGLVARDAAGFFGAFDDTGILIASLGIVPLPTVGAIARYQDVHTAPAHRRRGLAGAMLSAAAAYAKQHGAERTVIVTEPGSAAERVYTRVGFAPIELTVSALRSPEARSPSLEAH